jgi:hypothetical protein
VDEEIRAYHAWLKERVADAMRRAAPFVPEGPEGVHQRNRRAFRHVQGGVEVTALVVWETALAEFEKQFPQLTQSS